MENARAHQKHQHLLIGNACALIHGVQAVQKTFDFSLIEVRNRGKHPARAKGALHERKESGAAVDGRGMVELVHYRWQKGETTLESVHALSNRRCSYAAF